MYKVRVSYEHDFNLITSQDFLSTSQFLRASIIIEKLKLDTFDDRFFEAQYLVEIISWFAISTKVRAVKFLSLSFTHRAERDAMLFNRGSALIVTLISPFLLFTAYLH